MPVPSVPVEKLHKRLNFREPIDYPSTSRTKPLTDWKMEVDDSPIFRYLYRNFRPRRHLEFGTWQGTGTVYCLEECDASVWTINLPFGVPNRPDGWAAYGNEPSEAEEVIAWAAKVGLERVKKYNWTDRLGFIGRHYLQRELGNRVCQIYCDSKDWDISQFPPDFFDSALIDGGHTPDIVLSDTRKALQVLAPGGLIIWHDYCLDPAVQKDFSTPRDIVAGLEANFSWIRPQLKDLFWIEPSWMLVGVKTGRRGRASGYLRRLRNAVLAVPTEVGRENGTA